jgi:hypothetical protein
VTAFLFFIAFLALSQQKDTGKIDTKAEFFVSMTWPDTLPTTSTFSCRTRSATWSGTAVATSAFYRWSATTGVAPTTS